MRWLLAIVAGLVAGVVGWLATGAAAAWIAGLFGMSDFEGARGMFAFLAVGPLGGLLAMVLAVWAVMRRGGERARLGAMLARVGGVLAAIAVVVVGGVALRLVTSDTYTDELPPTLEFEIRAPAALVPDERSAIAITLDTDRNGADALVSEVRTAGDARVIAGSVPLAYKTRQRLLVVRLPDQPVRLFSPGLGRDPASTPTLGAWERAKWIDRQADDGQPEAAPKDDPVELRWRVRRAGDP